MRKIEEILEIKQELKDHFGTCRDNYSQLDSYYNLSVPIGKIPPDIEVYKPPTAREDVNAAVNHIMILGQDVYIPLWSETDEAKKMASKLSKFGKAFLYQLDRKYKNARRNCIKNAILYGSFIMKGPLYIPRVQGEMSDKEWNKHLLSTFPFYFRSCNPHNVVWIDGDCVVEFHKRKAIEVKQNWTEWDMKNHKLFDDVDWWEYWSNDQRTYFIENEVIDDSENTYGFIPYEIGYGGFGVESSEGKPEDLIVSMIAPALSTYKMEYRAKTAEFSGLEYAMWSRPVMNRPMHDWERLANSPGEMSYIGTDSGLMNFAPPSISGDVYDMLGIIADDLEKVSPGVLHGRGSKYETGYGQAARMDYARVSLLTSLIADWEGAAGNILDKTISLIKNEVEEPVGILGALTEEKAMITIKPEEINPSLHHFFVRLDAQTPEQKEHRWRMGMDSWRVGSLSMESLHRDFYGIDHLTEYQRILVEQALSNPAVIQKITEEALTDVGMRDLMGLIQQGKFNKPMPEHGIGGESNENMRLEAKPGSMGSELKATEYR